MITLYFLAAFFIAGWMFGVDYMNEIKWTFWERVGVAALALVWPFLLFLMWSEWRKP